MFYIIDYCFVQMLCFYRLKQMILLLMKTKHHQWVVMSDDTTFIADVFILVLLDLNPAVTCKSLCFYKEIMSVGMP